MTFVVVEDEIKLTEMIDTMIAWIYVERLCI